MLFLSYSIEDLRFYFITSVNNVYGLLPVLNVAVPLLIRLLPLLGPLLPGLIVALPLTRLIFIVQKSFQLFVFSPCCISRILIISSI